MLWLNYIRAWMVLVFLTPPRWRCGFWALSAPRPPAPGIRARALFCPGKSWWWLSFRYEIPLKVFSLKSRNAGSSCECLFLNETFNHGLFHGLKIKFQIYREWGKKPVRYHIFKCQLIQWCLWWGKSMSALQREIMPSLVLCHWFLLWNLTSLPCFSTFQLGAFHACLSPDTSVCVWCRNLSWMINIWYSSQVATWDVPMSPIRCLAQVLVPLLWI